MPPIQFPMRRFAVSADLFERWMLKTTINLAVMSKPRPEAGVFEKGGRPTKRYVDIAFGLAEFDPDEGLSWVATVGENIKMNQIGTIAFAPWYRRSDGALVAAQLSYHGYRLWLAAEGAPGIEDTLRLRKFRAANVAVEIDFIWSRRLSA